MFFVSCFFCLLLLLLLLVTSCPTDQISQKNITPFTVHLTKSVTFANGDVRQESKSSLRFFTPQTMPTLAGMLKDGARRRKKEGGDGGDGDGWDEDGGAGDGGGQVVDAAAVWEFSSTSPRADMTCSPLPLLLPNKLSPGAILKLLSPLMGSSN